MKQEYLVTVSAESTIWREWWIGGQRYREDGPAVEYSGGYRKWYLDGLQITEEEHKRRTSKSSCEGKIVIVDGVEYELRAKKLSK